MPTVLRAGPYRFFFYASDRDEPPHIHVERDDNVAKFWLDHRIARIVSEHGTKLLEAWSEYFGR